MTPILATQKPPVLLRVAQWLAQPSVAPWLLMPAFVWFVGGLFLDGWAHNHGKVDNTFFTPWHAVFYSGYLAVASVLAVLVWGSWMRGEHWQRALAGPYRVAILAAPGFGMAGVADLWWHTTYGFEAGIELLLSPPHLALASSMACICLAPARTDTPRDSMAARVPALLSILSAWSIATFILQFNHPFGIVWPQQTRIGETGVSVGVVGIVFHMAVTGVIGAWLVTRRFAPGSLTVIVVINALLIALMGDEYRFAVGVGAAALLCEGLNTLLTRRGVPITQRSTIQAGALAGLATVGYFGVIAATGVLVWPLSLCAGVCLLSTLLALLTQRTLYLGAASRA
jgi:hypothetical protein